MRTWFTADTHYGHANIIKYCQRPFADVNVMRDALVTRWNTVVADDDQVFVLGDFALGRIEQTLLVLNDLRGTKHLVVGNHDRPFDPDPRRRAVWTSTYLEAGFQSVTHGTAGYLLQGKYPALIGHFPYAGDSHDTDRYSELRPFDAGLPLVHGHVHTTWRLRGREFNVGVDVNDYTPVSEDDVVQALSL